MSNARYQALAGRIEAQAKQVACDRFTPVNADERRALSARYRRVVNVLMRQSREAFAKVVAS